MKLGFDFDTVQATEFGVGIDEDEGQRFVLIPVDADVQVALQEVAIGTREEMNEAMGPEANFPDLPVQLGKGSSLVH